MVEFWRALRVQVLQKLLFLRHVRRVQRQNQTQRLSGIVMASKPCRAVAPLRRSVPAQGRNGLGGGRLNLRIKRETQDERAGQPADPRFSFHDESPLPTW